MKMGHILRAIAYICLAALASPISQATLAPSFGAIPSSHKHAGMILVTFTFGCFLALLPSASPRWTKFMSRLRFAWVCYFPIMQQFILPYNGSLGPVGGPIVNGLVSCHVVLITSAFGAASELIHISLIGGFILPLLALAGFSKLESCFTYLVKYLLTHTPSTPVSINFFQMTAHGLLSPGMQQLFAIPAILQILFFNPHRSISSINHALAPQNWSLVDRAWSNTGYISVLENHADGYRVLRCDHSLLGGEWMLTPERQAKEGWQVTEPTYAVFEMLEAVRLIRRERPVPDAEARALVIGVGIGTAPKALISHGINTTVIELDPVVHEFATKYFDLPQNHTAVLEDAVGWVAAAAEQTQQTEEGKTKGIRQEAARGSKDVSFLWDYIVHDVFTGGAEPLALFNAQFLRHLRALLRPDGIIALNYAGDLSLPLTRHILRTIEHVFDGHRQCRIFRDGPPPPPPATGNPAQTTADDADAHNKHSAANREKAQEKAKAHRRLSEEKKQALASAPGEDFLNMVVFCRNDVEGGPISFRPPVRADYLRSKSRQYYLLPNDEYEMAFPDDGEEGTQEEDKMAKETDGDGAVGDGRLRSEDKENGDSGSDAVAKGILEAGDENLWETQQLESAIRHWQIMRKVVPDVVWDLW